MPSPHRIPRGGKTCLEITCQFDPRHGFPRQAFTTYDCLLISVAFVVLCRVGCLWVTGVISIDEIRLAPSINRTHDPSPMIRSPTLYWLQPHRPTPPPPPPPPPPPSAPIMKIFIACLHLMQNIKINTLHQVK